MRSHYPVARNDDRNGVGTTCGTQRPDRSRSSHLACYGSVGFGCPIRYAQQGSPYTALKNTTLTEVQWWQHRRIGALAKQVCTQP